MKIRVKMFAILKERSGVGEMEMELPDGATVSRAVETVKNRFGELADLLPRAAAAVNLATVDGAMVLQDGDELALIPPVSGG